MDHLPTFLLKHVFEFVGSTKALLSCTLVCKPWNGLLKEDDSIWKYCEGNHPVLEGQVPLAPDTWRESALVHRALELCEAYKDFCGSVFVQTILNSELQTYWWNCLVCQIVTFLIVREAPHLHVRLRSDTQLLLLNIVENFVSQELQRVFYHALDTAGYPTARGKELGGLGSYGRGGYEGNDDFSFSILHPAKQSKEFLLREYLVTRITMYDDADAAIRRAAFRAGIPKIDTAMYGFMENILVWVLYNLLRPAVIQAGCREPAEAQPPLVVRQLIAPQIIQETAKRMGISHQVYGIDIEDSSDEYEFVPHSEAGPGNSAILEDCMDVAEDDEDNSYVDSEQGYREDEVFDDMFHGDPDGIAQCSESDKDDDSIQAAFSGMDLS